MNRPSHLVRCAECGSKIAAQAEACPECGYPHLSATLLARSGDPGRDRAGTAHAQYRLLQAGGLIILVAGVLAALADSRFAAGVTLAAGAALYLAGLLGAWWNRHE